MNAELNKEAGLYTQIRTLRKRIDSLDMGKVNPTELKSAIDSLHDLETRYADMQEKKKQRSIEKQNREKELAAIPVVSEEVKPESVPVEAAPIVAAPVEPEPVLLNPSVVAAPVVTAEVEPVAPEKTADEPKPVEKLDKMDLSKDPEFDSMIASALYMKMLEYLVMEDTPEQQMIIKFKKAIERIQNEEDKEKLKACFNEKFGGGVKTPWDYYEEAQKAPKETEITPEAKTEVKADTSKFALDDVVEPIYGTTGSMGRVMRYDADKDMAYVHWDSGKLADDHGFGAYKGTDLKKRASTVEAGEREISYEKCTCGHMKFDHETEDGKTKCDECKCTGFSKKASLEKQAHVVEEDGKWFVYNHDKSKKLSKGYGSKSEAVKRLQQIEYFKHEGSAKEATTENVDQVRCNNCYGIYPQETQICPKCQTDKYMMQPFMNDDADAASPVDPNEALGEGYGGDRPGIAVAPKANLKQAAKINVANREWEIIPKYDLVGDSTKLLGYDIMSDTGERAGFIKTDKPLNQQVIEQEIWNKLNGHNAVQATLKTNLSVLKKGHKVRIVSVDLARKEAKFASLEMKSVTGWTTLDKFDFVITAAEDKPEAHMDAKCKECGEKVPLSFKKDALCRDCEKKKEHKNMEAQLLPLSKTDRVVRIKSHKLLLDLAEQCPDCYKKFLKFASERGLIIRADDLSTHVEQVRTKINQTKEVLQQQTQAADAPEKIETEAELPPKPNVTLPSGMKWMYNIDTNTWDMVTDSQFTY